MKPITFSGLRRQVNKATATDAKKFRDNLTDQIKQGVNLAGNWYYKGLFTPKKLNAYTAGSMTKKDVIAHLVERYARNLSKEKERYLDKIAAATETGGAREIVVSLVWTPAPTGNVCHASVEAITAENYRYRAEGRAGGYGYDKASSAAAAAFAQLPPVLYHIYKMANAKKELPYGASSKRLAVPFFDGGVGMSCFVNVFKEAGLKKYRYFGTKHTDLYVFSKK